jgi:Icc-related predicted phosphoesterase
MSDNVFRWLHLSDFHVGKDAYGQQCLFKYILSNVKQAFESARQPSAVFITGDISNTGVDSEYQVFLDQFFWPLQDILHETSCADRVFLVPGNHDVAWHQARAVRSHGILSHIPTFLDPTVDAQFDRASILPRFKAFMDNDPTSGGSTSHWIGSPDGALIRRLSFGCQQIGILGLNTAWLSCDGDDRHELSPGKAILEKGLSEVSDSDLTFVLAHHPIEWLLDEEVSSIRTMLSKHPVIYLHGHLHKSRGQTEQAGGNTFLEIEAGASFQARENEKWINRIIWGEADLPARVIRLMPFLWSRDHQEWVIDASAFPSKFRVLGQDCWQMPLPAGQPESSESLKRTLKGLTGMHAALPLGWSVLTKGSLDPLRKPLSDEEIIAFFDGRVPAWQEALSPKIPRRLCVHGLVAEIERWLSNPIVSLFLVKGAGGEGKSTVLRQAIVDLLDRDIVRQVVWNESAESGSPDLSHFPEGSGPWIIASDDAENVAKDLFLLAKVASKKGISGICLLLSCRDTDWMSARCDLLPWETFTQVAQTHLRGLSENDAEAIVTAWARYERRGLGRLYGLPQGEAIAALVNEARNEAYAEEGAFLGAMLRTRLGEDIKAHVKNLLLSLAETNGPGGTLRDAFACIAVPHAENVLTLSRGPLAKVLGCSRAELKEKVLGPLGEEAVVAPSGQFVLTRHRAIAEAALHVLSNDFHVDTDEILLQLMKAALELSDFHIFVPSLPSWRFLSTHFFNAGRRELAVRLAQAAYEHDRDNPFFIVQFAKLLREAAQPDMSVEIFHRASRGIRRDRTFYFEWGISEGVAGHRCNSISLAAASLADNTDRTWPSVEDATKAFAGMGTTFGRLYQLYDALVFLEACSATAQLGLSTRHDEKGAKYFREAEAQSRDGGVENVSLPQAFSRFTKGILAAWERRESDLSDWITGAPALRYEHLRHLLHLPASESGPGPAAL